MQGGAWTPQHGCVLWGLTPASVWTVQPCLEQLQSGHRWWWDWRGTLSFPLWHSASSSGTSCTSS